MIDTTYRAPQNPIVQSSYGDIVFYENNPPQPSFFLCYSTNASIWSFLAIMYTISFVFFLLSIKYWHICTNYMLVLHWLYNVSVCQAGPFKRQRPIHPVQFQIVVEAASSPIKLIYLFQTKFVIKWKPYLFLHPFIQHALESSLISRAPYQFVGHVSELYNVEADGHGEQGAFKENHSPCASKVSSHSFGLIFSIHATDGPACHDVNPIHWTSHCLVVGSYNVHISRYKDEFSGEKLLIRQEIFNPRFHWHLHFVCVLEWHLVVG